MSRALTLVWPAIILLATSGFGQEAVTYGPPAPLVGHCVAVTDGDSIKVVVADNQLLRIRLAFIDAPEMHQDFGYRAKQAMSELVFGKQIELRTQAVDRYGRTVAIVYVNGTDAGLALLTTGLAWPYYKYLAEAPLALQDAYRDAAARAQDNRLGLWAQHNPMPPWEFRRASQP